MSTLADRILAEAQEGRSASGIAVAATYQPAGGPDEKVMPPTFPNDGRDTPYLVEPRWIDGERHEAVVLDQAQSQANRVEEALLAARDAGRLPMPLFEMVVPTARGAVRLTSLDFPHRYADAYLRDSEIGGVRFDKTPAGARLREASTDDVRPLYEREPCSLLFGAWDSHRKGRWPKFARVYASSVIGIDPLLGERAAGRMDPVNLTGIVDDKEKAEGDWKFAHAGEKAKGKKLSEIGHGNIAPGSTHGGVSVRSVRRTGWVSFAGLDRLRFGDAAPEAAALARATLAALALAGDRLAFGQPSVWLRSGCDLTRVAETIGFELAGGTVDALAVTADDAVEAYVDLRDRAAAAGIPMAADSVAVEPIGALRSAVEFAVTSATPDGE
ncbi:MAG: CRISPR-associated protein Csb1 [Frankiaceae bacterium]|jgi:CRISPR-associated protein Csb1|nr:CRISPR-associated protein Csb1 [Frankiaceae bacterium]